MALLVLIVVVVTSVLIAVDSNVNQIASSDQPYSANNGWLAWLAGCLLLWIVFAPWYLIRRSQVMSDRRMGIQPGVQPAPPAPQWTYCPACRGGNHQTATFCQWCGAPLSSPSGMAVPPRLEGS